jgi:hypothetical protein
MAIYPDDATVSATAFSQTGVVSYESTGFDSTFELAANIDFVAESIVTIDGITQDVSTYYLEPRGNAISFFSPPTASNLTIRTIDLPLRFRTTRTYPATFYAHYSNTAATTIASNTYLLNGVTTAFSLPTGALGSVNSANSLLVTITGVVQDFTAFTYPSATLGLNGIDLPEALSNSSVDPTYATQTLEIRASVQEVQTLGSFSDMRDRKPDVGTTSEKEFKTVKFESQAGYEKRRLMSRRPKRKFGLSYTNVTGVEKQAIDDFYTARGGEFETFTFDLSHINESGTVRVRFDGKLDITHVASRGSNLVDNFYVVKLSLQEDYN